MPWPVISIDLVVVVIKAVVFDFGGVFAKEVMSLIYNETAKRTGVGLDVVKSEIHKLIPSAQRGEKAMNEFWKALAQKLNSTPSLIEVVWTKTFENNIKIDKEVEKIIRKLKKDGYNVVVCTNTIETFSEIHKRNKNYNIFDFVVISCEISMRKPDREIYEFVLKKLNVEPEECVFVDDKLENVEGAKKIGLKAILFRDASQLKEDLKRCDIRGL